MHTLCKKIRGRTDRMELVSFRLPLTSLCDRLLLFVYFQVNNGVV